MIRVISLKLQWFIQKFTSKFENSLSANWRFTFASLGMLVTCITNRNANFFNSQPEKPDLY